MISQMSNLIAFSLLCAVASAERQEVCSHPGLAIPPSGSSGCCTEDSIVSDASRYSLVKDVTVSVNLEHTHIGELAIDVRHEESGQIVTLFLYQCGDSDDLNVAFSDEAHEAVNCEQRSGGHTYLPLDSLDAFNGLQSASHTWTISVNDNGNGDEGILHSWCLSFDTEPQYVASSQREEKCSNPGLDIPVSGSSGCCTEDSIVTFVSSDFEMTAFQVTVNLSHTNLGDLAIDLRNEESGQSVPLFLQECGDIDDLYATYTDYASEMLDCGPQRTKGLRFVPLSPLAAFDGLQGYNTWTLSISDSFVNHVGTLHDWCLSFGTEAAPPSEDSVEERSECAYDLDLGIHTYTSHSISHTLAAGRSLKHVGIALNLDHSKVDLVITVTHEESQASVIVYNRECPNDVDLNIVFTDEASEALADPCRNHDQSITFLPSQALAAFDEMSYANNTWTLSIDDESGSEHSGILHDWCVTFDHSVPRYVTLDESAQSMGEANAMCAEMFGTELAIIRDASQQLEAERICGASGTASYCWLGLIDYDTDGVFTWIDGSQLTYANWYDTEPNSGASCAAMHHSNWQWYDQWCDNDGRIPLCRNPDRIS